LGSRSKLTQKGRDNEAPSINLINTLKYLRLRRNHFIHATDDALSAEMTKLIRHSSSQLQAYWSGKSSILGLSFLSTNIGTFTPDEGITLIKLVRVCIEEIDAYIASFVKVEQVIRDINLQLLKKRPELKELTQHSVDRRIRKIRKRAMELYGINSTYKEIAAIINIMI
jgi:hypothetical protein